MNFTVVLLLVVAVANGRVLVSDNLSRSIRELLQPCQEKVGNPGSPDLVKSLLAAGPLHTEADKCILFCMQQHLRLTDEQATLVPEILTAAALEVSNMEVAEKILKDCNEINENETMCQRGYARYTCAFDKVREWMQTS